MILFDYTVKSISLYGTTFANGQREDRMIKKIQEKYTKWVLGLKTKRSAYIVLAKTKRDKLSIDAKKKDRYNLKKTLKFEENVKNNKNLLSAEENK